MKTKNYKLSFFLYFLFFGIIIELITVGIVYTYNYYEIQKQLQEKYKIESSIKKNDLLSITKRVESSINSISKNKIFLDYLENQSQKNEHAVQQLFYYVSSENKSYMQVRYLDKQGKERIRVNRKTINSQPNIIADEKLQNKSKRYYFKDTMSLKKEMFWYSNLDLNMESGKIEIPYKSTLRIAKKVIYNEKVQGIIIINILMDDVLKKLLISHNFNINLIDKDGFYIYSINPLNSWSKILKTNKNIKQNIQMSALKGKEFKTENSFFIQIDDIIRSDQKPYLVFTEKNEIIENLKKQDAYIAFWIMLIVLLISVPLAYFISSIPSTLQKKLQLTLEDLQKFATIVDNYVMTLVVDTKGKIKSVSNAFCKRSGYSKEDLLEKNYSLFATKVKDDIHKSSHLINGDMVVTAKSGSAFYVKQTVTPLTKNSNEFKKYTIFLKDDTERREMEARSLTDPLTKIFNRAGIDKYLLRELHLTKRHGNSLSIVIIDIDFFKKVNDTYGHQAGDTVIIELAQILTQHTRKTDIVGRLGGEEFIVILPHTSKKGALSLAEELRQKVQHYNFSIDSSITISLGVATLMPEDTMKSIIRRADTALYEAKNSGRNKVCFS